MSEKSEIEAEASAVKAYAAAAEAAVPEAARPLPAASQVEAEVEFPSKAKRTAKAEAPTPVVEAKPRAKVKPGPSRKVAPARLVGKPKTVTTKASATAKSVRPKAAASIETAAPKIPAKTLFQQFKDTTMNTTEFTTKIKSAVNEAQAKAKDAFGKGAATFHEYNEFSKGNVEAVVATGKILAGGLQALGKVYVEDSKAAFANLTGEVKELASAKSPADFFKLQGELLRRNFGAAVAATSKNSEAVLKLAGEAAAPISARVNLAVEKVKQTA